VLVPHAAQVPPSVTLAILVRIRRTHQTMPTVRSCHCPLCGLPVGAATHKVALRTQDSSRQSSLGGQECTRTTTSAQTVPRAVDSKGCHDGGHVQAGAEDVVPVTCSCNQMAYLATNVTELRPRHPFLKMCVRLIKSVRIVRATANTAARADCPLQGSSALWPRGIMRVVVCLVVLAQLG
jgi:hypothetical protein